jgi:hypothetical protein
VIWKFGQNKNENHDFQRISKQNRTHYIFMTRTLKTAGGGPPAVDVQIKLFEIKR